jgi:hypothetical protein
MAIQRCPLIYAYDVSPAQTYHFEPDVYYDVTEALCFAGLRMFTG